MKRYINASVGYTEKLHKLINHLSYEGVDEHTMLEFFFDNLSSEQCYKMMLQLADECDIDVEGM